ncbi:MAG: hypothetical protein HUJ22_12780 [Gracilimonas sp.]|uniref:hypothetical protein n=1 Tax=Gracilimonas sp. TaxID=1974203 RepID=UPI0019AF6ABF|nr:hypothetical protein [Gracilimonas sp.]MBD3617436.1 hypothetical protein [Gracilimonas sp.]
MIKNITQRVQLPLLFLTIIALTFTGCKDMMANSSEDIESESLTSVLENETDSNNTPDGLLPNSQQYNNSSKPVATGKSGGVTLTARAMMNSQMIVDLEVTSGELDSDEEAPGTITKVRVKALDTDNPDPDNPVWEENYNKLDDGGSFTESFENLIHGQQLDIHANVREMFADKKNSHRTGIISLLEDVKFRPDLAITNIDAPAEVFVQDPVIIDAEVSENLGDLGATADCILRIDGNEIDRAAGIWVDAGDAVLCSFQTQFETTGTRNGEVSVENVTPGDFDNGNNSSTFQIEVTEPNINNFNWSGNALIDIEDYTEYSSNWRYGDVSSTRNLTGKRQSLTIYSSVENSIGFPMDIDVNVTSGSYTWLNESLTSVNPDNSYTRYDMRRVYLPNNSYIQIIKYNNDNLTRVNLRRYARNVVYYGYDYYGDYYYFEYDDTMLPYGNDVTFKLTFDGSNGLAATLAGEILLIEGTESYSYCYDYGCKSLDSHYLSGDASGSSD